MKLNLESILMKKDMALDEISGVLDKAITTAFESGQNLSEETKKTLETYKAELKGASKEKIDSIIVNLQKLSDNLASDKEKKEAEMQAEREAGKA